MIMKKLAIFSLVSFISLATFSLAPIEKGDKVPDFTASDENGDLWQLSDQRTAYLVIYFYPAAFTGGCTAQACSYRDHESDFSKLNAKVIGVSGDDYENNDRAKKCGGFFCEVGDFDFLQLCGFIDDGDGGNERDQPERCL